MRFRPLGIAALSGFLALTVLCGPGAARAYAAEAAPAGDILSLGDPDAPQQIDLYLDPLCPFSGKMVRDQGTEIGQRVEAGKLHINLRFVDFLDKYSASTTYDRRAIYAAFIVADHSRSSDVAWRFIEQIYAKGQQPKEEGDTDLSNDQLADLANQVGAPQSAQDMIRLGLPDPGVPMVIINGEPVDGNSDWLKRL